mmetsp:Transcript_8076/g.18903  ORF Transcript_8076/g.18903 Transcript_8076/m.18903 type:complete len:93 (+) Transcript_8076:50-328(+)
MEDRSKQGKPPIGWSAASSSSRSLNKELTAVADKAGEGAQPGGGGQGPALPFRIKDAYVWGQRCSNQPVYSMSMPLNPPGSDKEVQHIMAFI